MYMICMDYVDGLDLGELHDKHIRNDLLLPVPLAAFIVSRICRALGYAHESIIHRDISPENILINTHGVCKLTDFGVAVETDEPVQLLAGKIRYMAPEQVREKNVDDRADIFSLGVVAYEILTGISLFGSHEGDQLTERLENVQQLHRTPPPPPHKVRPDIPETLSGIVMDMLAFDPADRYQEIAEAGNKLEQDYLYAEGFGPTNNSLKAYIRIFRSGYEQYNESQLKQLRFLEEDGKIKLRRHIQKSEYTRKGWAFLKSRGF